LRSAYEDRRRGSLVWFDQAGRASRPQREHG